MNLFQVSDEEKELYEKLGYKYIFEDKSQEEIEYFRNYLLPITTTYQANKNFICKCGFLNNCYRNSLCFICGESITFNGNITKVHKTVKFNSLIGENKGSIFIEKKDKNYIKASYIKGFLAVNWEEKTAELSNVEKFVLEVKLVNDKYIFILNDKEVNLIEFLASFRLKQSSSHIFLSNLVYIFEQMSDKSKVVRNIFKTSDKDIERLQKLYDRCDGSEKYLYQKELNEAKANKITKTVYHLYDAYILPYLDTEFSDILDDTSLIKHKGNINYFNSNYYYTYKLAAMINETFDVLLSFNLKSILKKNKVTFKDALNGNADLYELLKMTNDETKNLKLIKNLNKEQKESLTYLYKQFSSLNEFHLNSNDIVNLISIYKLIKIDMEELKDYIHHISENEGMESSEIIRHYKTYVSNTKRKNKDKLDKVPLPINLKLNSRLSSK